MNDKNFGLETFVDHHRADFDAFEPRPDLWDAIALDLDQTETAQPDETPLRVVPLFPEVEFAPVGAPDTAAVRSARPYGVAAAVAALLLLGTWFWQHGTEATVWTRTGRPAVAQASAPVVTDYYNGPEWQATAAAAGPEQRLASAVQRMEAYYAAQLMERQQELRQIDAETAAAPRADWQQELAALDSTYQQLKTELYRNPEPDVVLEAMNRNMQIRLDLLAQQLRTRERIRDYHNQPYMVADSRRLP